MRRRACRRRAASLLSVLALISAAGLCSGQQPEASHRERFASGKERLEGRERQFSARVEANPNDVEALRERGLTRVRLGKDEEAVADLNRAAELAPSSADARVSLAYAYWAEGRPAEALDAARAALALDSDNPSAHFYVGRILLAMRRDVAQAAQHLERAVERSPDDAEMRFYLMTAYRELGDVVRAGAQVRLLRVSLPPNDARVFYAEGLLQTDLGNMETAIDRFRRSLAADPRRDPVRQDLGVALVQAGRWQEAVEVLEPLRTSQPQSFAAAYFHALALENAQRREEAEAEARRALGLKPDSADAQTLLGIILAARGAHDQAVESLARAVELDAGNFDARFYLGRARYALRDLAGAREAFRAAVGLRPEHVEARFFLATVLEAAGEKDAAIAEYRELVARRPEDARSYVGLGAILAKYGETAEALAQLRGAREIAPRHFEAALALGRLLVKEGQLEDGLRHLQEAAALEPHSTEAHYQLGLALRRAGRAQEAEQEFATVDRLNREYRSAGPGMGPPEKKE